MEAVILKFIDNNKVIATIGYQDEIYLPRVGEHVIAREQNTKAKKHVGVVFCVKHNIENDKVIVFLRKIK